MLVRLVLAIVLLAFTSADAAEARGTVLLFHGGGWNRVGPVPTAALAPKAASFRAAGLRAQSLDYRRGDEGLIDVVAAVDEQLAAHPNSPLCLYGESAGGHLALLAAAARPQVRCVITAAAPTDLVHATPMLRDIAMPWFAGE